MCSVIGCRSKNFENSDKCILHCEKDDWYELDENKKRIWSEKKVNDFWDTIQKGLDLRYGWIINTPELGKDIYTFDKVRFPIFQVDIEYDPIFLNEEELNTNFFSYGEFEISQDEFETHLNRVFEEILITFNNCVFLDNADFTRYKFKKTILFENCEFKKDINFSEQEFENDFRFKNCKVEGNIDFYKTKFLQLADFYGTKFTNVKFERTKFKNMAVFTKCNFYKNIDFKHVKFFDETIFRESTFHKKLNLRETSFSVTPSFLDIKSTNKDDNIAVSNRETARIIKDSFEQKNNFIEANKFYSLEMKEREKELDKDRKEGENLYEWLVFKIHQISSNHSHDWALALFWIFIVGFATSLFNFYIDNKSFSFLSFIGIIVLVSYAIWIDYISKRENEIKSILLVVLFYLIYIYETKDIYLCEFTKVINPFGKFTDLNLLDLLSKVIIAYLIYQLIISIRQNTRRK